MILLLSAVAGIVLGLLFGGRLKNCAAYPLKGFWLPVAAFCVKAVAAWLLRPQTGAIAVCLVQYTLIFAFIVINIARGLWPTLVLAGSVSNFLVILLNGGCMPVSTQLLVSGTERAEQLLNGQIYAYCVAGADTALPFLGDVLRIGSAGTPVGFASAGDIVLCCGIAILCFQMTRWKAYKGDGRGTGGRDTMHGRTEQT
ncbi:MAG TPA: DUF5317 family protein [Eubacteriales bacterium]|nr:DUF5317 family protein [Eubacteriales bacterium]